MTATPWWPHRQNLTANPLELYDLGGNAAEWCHDYYSIYPYDSQKVYEDPLGPEEGKHHLIRGSSWRQSSISALRSSYRDYNDGKRLDLGFRVCTVFEIEAVQFYNSF